MSLPRRADLERLYAYPDTIDPWVRLCFVTTLDGSVTGGDGVSGTLGGEADVAAYRVMRDVCDVVLVGAGTARAEGYGPIAPGSVDAGLRERLGLSPVPVLALVSSTLDVPDPLLRPDVIVLTCAAANEERRAEVAARADLVVAGDETIDWPAALAALADRGLLRVLCEGGPHLAGTLATLDLLDELCLTVAPTLVGGSGSRVTRDAPDLDQSFRLGHVVPTGDVLLTRWLRART